MNNEIVDRIELIRVPVFDLYFRRKRCDVFAISSVDYCQEWAAFDQSRLKVGHSQAFVSSVKSSNSHTDLIVTHPTHPLFQITPVLNTGLSLSEPLELYKGYNAI